MAQEKSFDWISSVVSLIKWTLVAIVVWFVVGAGMAGLYHWYKREVVIMTTDDEKAERFGNKAFLFWLFFTFLFCYWVADTTDLEVYDQLFRIFAWFQIIFFSICIAGLSYYWRKIV